MYFAYDENGTYREFEEYESVVTCPNCGKKYRQVTVEQVPGFREKEYDICPYCHAENGCSMSEEYMNYPLEGQG